MTNNWKELSWATVGVPRHQKGCLSLFLGTGGLQFPRPLCGPTSLSRPHFSLMRWASVLVWLYLPRVLELQVILCWLAWSPATKSYFLRRNIWLALLSWWPGSLGRQCGQVWGLWLWKQSPGILARVPLLYDSQGHACNTCWGWLTDPGPVLFNLLTT